MPHSSISTQHITQAVCSMWKNLYSLGALCHKPMNSPEGIA